MDKLLNYILTKYYGLKEVIGVAYSPTILTWVRNYYPQTKDDEEVPYCSIGLIECCKELDINIPSTITPAAISWLTLTTSITLTEALLGDIVVLGRIGGNHVGLFVRYSEKQGKVYILGFNQNNQCNITAFDSSTIKGIRRI